MTSRLKRDRARKRFAELISISEDEPFLQMIWCMNRIRNGGYEVGARGISDLPPDFAQVVKNNSLMIQPWVLEDLCNELMTVAKPRIPARHQLRCTSYNGFQTIYNSMLNVEDSESGYQLSSGQNVLQAMPRYGHRQFEWQRGWMNAPAFYRSAFIYGSGESGTWFLDTHGCSVTDFMLFGMAATSAFSARPDVSVSSIVVPQLGLSLEQVLPSLRLSAASAADFRKEAGYLRRGPLDIAARPSILRRTPILGFGQGSNRLRAPLPELIIERVTTGLYLDLVKGPDALRTAMGQKFERYCFDLLTAAFDSGVREEYPYGPRNRQTRSPDILIGPADSIELIVECKATRMSFDVRFSEAWHAATDRGYRELAKGVGQIWRHCSHMRRGIVPDRPSHDLSGLVLTIDPWLRMTHGQDEIIFRMAREWCVANDPDIRPEDECPIGFTHIQDIEALIHRTDAAGLLKTLRRAAGKIGWLANELGEDERVAKLRRPYLLGDRMREVLPWWQKTGG